MVFLCLLLLIFSTVDAGDITKPNGYNSSAGWADYIGMSEEIVSQYIKTMPRSVYVTSTGGSYTYEVRYVSPSFATHAKVDIGEARRMLVMEANKLMALFNANQKIRPYLHDFPFTQKNVRYGLSFRDGKGQHHADGSVTHVFNTDKEIIYSTLNPVTGQLEDLHVETWEEAVELLAAQVQDSQSNTPKNQSSTKFARKVRQ